MAYCSLLPNHSTDIKTKMQKAAISISEGFTCGLDNIELENIFLIIENACCKLFALKNIHAKTVRPKVRSIDNTSLTVGHLLSLATISILLRCVLKIIEGIIYNAFSKPQTINVQLAPCQKPLTRKMINVFRTFTQILTWLPPSGMYK